MSVFYALIAKNKDIVLCEYTDYYGNYQQISRMILRKINPETKATINYDNYQFHYISENDMTFLCLSDGLPSNLSYAFLRDLQKNFYSKYDKEQINNAGAYQLNNYEKYISQLISYYNNNPRLTKNGDIIRLLTEYKKLEVINVDNILDRDQKLNIVAQKELFMSSQNKNINLLTQQIIMQKRKKTIKYVALCLLGILIVAYLFSKII